MKCPKCKQEVGVVIVEEKAFHKIEVHGTVRKVDWNIHGVPLGLIIFHKGAEDDEPCMFTPADREDELITLASWLLSEDDDVYPELEHLFAESEVVSSDQGA